MIAFQPTGSVLTFTSASSAPTSVQAISYDNEQSQQVVLTNVDATNDAVIGWGPSDELAKLNAAVATLSPNSYYLLHGTQVVVTVPPRAYFTGIAVASTAVIKVQAGKGN